MATEVRALQVRDELRAYKKEGGREGSADRRRLVTRDLLGGCSAAVGSSSYQLEPAAGSRGWEKRRDLAQEEHQLQDLNLPPPHPSLELRLFPHPLAPPVTQYQSVCTLDKVRSALERAAARVNSCSSTTATTTASKEEEAESSSGSAGGGCASEPLVAAGCPSCLSYVLISEKDPTCPRCQSRVPTPRSRKKARVELDLNSADSVLYF